MFSLGWVSAPDYVLRGIAQATVSRLAFLIFCSERADLPGCSFPLPIIRLRNVVGRILGQRNPDQEKRTGEKTNNFQCCAAVWSHVSPCAECCGESCAISGLSQCKRLCARLRRPFGDVGRARAGEWRRRRERALRAHSRCLGGVWMHKQWRETSEGKQQRDGERPVER